VVEVVTGFDDLAVAHSENEDRRLRERLAGVGNGSLVLELGDDDLGVSCLVDCDVGRPPVQPRTGISRREVLT
jgi:hypothetical protein